MLQNCFYKKAFLEYTPPRHFVETIKNCKSFHQYYDYHKKYRQILHKY